MPVLIADGVARYAVNGTYAGHNIVNIVDMKIDTTGSLADRANSVDAQAGVILNAWHEEMRGLLNAGYTCESVSWLDLDSEDGSVGVRADTDVHTWPAPGTGGGQGAPGNVALRVNKNTVAKRGERQGRMYLVGFAESWTDAAQPNRLAAGIAAENAPSLSEFLDAINQDGTGLGDYTSQMVVVHTKAGVFQSSSVVTSLTCDEYTASQVRRIRR